MSAPAEPCPVTIPNPGGEDLPGILISPDDSRSLLVLAHGAGAGMEHAFMEAMAEQLAAEGVATLRFSFPYMARGRKAPDRQPVLLAAVEAAVAEGARMAGGRSLFAGGKSMGGRMTSLAAADGRFDDCGLRGLLFFGFPLHPAGRPSTQRGDHLSGVGFPLLFLQGDRDGLADLDLLRPVVAELGSRAILHVEEGADHGFHVLKRSGRTDAEVLGSLAGMAARWMAARGASETQG